MYGWPLLVHYCDTCHYNTTVDYTPTVWSQDHVCNHCGISAPGADLAGSSTAEMNQGQHDELAQLFAQQMQVSQQQQAFQQQQQNQQAQAQQVAPPVTESTPPDQPEKQAAADHEPIHFVSAHYYPGAAHIRPDTTSEPSRSPPPPYLEVLMPEAMADTLRQHSIDPNALLPNQVHLFQNADYEQRLRLLELWRIAPPSYPLEEHLTTGRWAPTNVQREEALARVRFEEQQYQQHQQVMNGRLPPPQEEHMLDTHIPEPISPIRDASDTPWPPAARMRAANIHSRSQSTAEPYIVSGYQSVDPVYAAAAGLWTAPSYAHAVEQQQGQGMEEQYGMFEQIRNHADWERRNEMLAREKLGMVGRGAGGGGEDCEMEL
ncbi:uncharacterized protein LTR77_010223 [Saxophila tyrrhenica]|uniref:GATA-type domain-containing protein n=1 Tax=Saxophila tyrrhenica TaxID=1690608 RepID=A0AAV9NZN2_9PEZI|nr:hypothetical protein LTR77_010223 [Saxophila tyrrhenica]